MAPEFDVAAQADSQHEPLKVPLKPVPDEDFKPSFTDVKATDTLAEDLARLAEENALLREQLHHERLSQENQLLQQCMYMQMQQHWQGPWAMQGAMPIPQGHWGEPLLDPMSCGMMADRASFASTGLPSDFDDPLSLSSSMESNSSMRTENLPADEIHEPQTTRMMRNLPNNYSRKMLLNLMDRHGFAARYNMVYLPIDFKTHANLGYAFINFVCVEDAEEFTTLFQGFSSWEHTSEKKCQITWSDTLQGLSAHIERYRSSPVMHESVADEFKPVLFRDGVRVPFPPPTKRIRAPRQWPRRSGHSGSSGPLQQNDV